MNFFRIFVDRKSGRVRHVMEQDTPFRVATIVEDEAMRGEALDVHDVGFVVAHDWSMHAPGTPEHGVRVAPSHHVWSRIGDHRAEHSMTLEQALDVMRGHPEMPEFHDTPCSLEGIRDRIRRQGVKSIPAAVRVWLTTTQPESVVMDLGVGQGVPLSAMKAAARMHIAAHPHGSDRTSRFERLAQARSDDHSARRHARRLAQKGE